MKEHDVTLVHTHFKNPGQSGILSTKTSPLHQQGALFHQSQSLKTKAVVQGITARRGKKHYQTRTAVCSKSPTFPVKQIIRLTQHKAITAPSNPFFCHTKFNEPFIASSWIWVHTQGTPPCVWQPCTRAVFSNTSRGSNLIEQGDKILMLL